jgi:hypothetical protein
LAGRPKGYFISFSVPVFFLGGFASFVSGIAASSPSFLTSVAGVCVSAGGASTPLTTDLVPFDERSQRLRPVIMKSIALIVVTLESREAAPLGPKTDWLPPPPNAPARSADFPD